jgi:aspartate/methionine/tyrosine aminotransferase
VAPALNGNREFQRNFLSELKGRRDFCVRRVRNNPGLSCEIPAAAFYLMIKADELGGHTDEQFVLDLLKETDVLVVHGSGFGMDPQQGYFRMVYLADEATLEEVFSRIDRFMATA